MPVLTIEQTEQLFHNVFDLEGLKEVIDGFNEANEELPFGEEDTFPIKEIASNPGFLEQTHLSEEAIAAIPEELDFNTAQKFEFLLRGVDHPILEARRLHYFILFDPEIRDLSREEKNRLLSIVPINFLTNLVAHPEFDIQHLPLLCDNLFDNAESDESKAKLFLIRNCIANNVLNIDNPQHRAIIDQIVASPQEKNYRFPNPHADSAANATETIYELTERMSAERLARTTSDPQLIHPMHLFSTKRVAAAKHAEGLALAAQEATAAAGSTAATSDSDEEEKDYPEFDETFLTTERRARASTMQVARPPLLRRTRSVTFSGNSAREAEALLNFDTAAGSHAEESESSAATPEQQPAAQPSNPTQAGKLAKAPEHSAQKP